MAPRRHRPSIPSSPAGADDLSNLSLIEVRERLKRNERVLNSGLFSPTPLTNSAGPAAYSPVMGSGAPASQQPGGSGTSHALPLPPAFSPSPGASPGSGSRAATLGSPSSASSSMLPAAGGVGAGSGSGSGQQSPLASAGVPIGIPGPSRSPAQAAFPGIGGPNGRYGTASTGTSPTNSSRDRLLAVRQALLERESQLVMAQASEGMEEMQLQEPAEGEGSLAARRRSSALSNTAPAEVRPGIGTSGKRIMLEKMIEKDKDLPKNSLILPVAETFHLAAREFDAETAAQLQNALSIGHTQSSSPKPRRTRPPHQTRAGRYPESPTAMRTPGRTSARQQSATDGEGQYGDEIDRAHYLARLNSFMGHRASDDEDDDEDEDGRLNNGRRGNNRGDEDEDDDDLDGADEYFQDGLASGAGLARGSAARGRKGTGMMADGIFDLDDAEDDAPLGYAGEDGRLDLGLSRERMERGTGEEIDADGEDDERFAEGNDDYQMAHGDGDLDMEMEMR